MNLKDDIKLIEGGVHDDPFSVLGMHVSKDNGEKAVHVRAFMPGTDRAWIIDERTWDEFVMQKSGKKGFFTVVIPSKKPFPYRIRVALHNGKTEEFKDPYSFGRVLTDFDIHLIGEGTHYRNYDKLGSHLMEVDGISGVHFAVWAPNAARVSVVGDFNHWDNRVHPLRRLGPSGIWEIFMPGLPEGEIYKFDIRSRYRNYTAEKSDPYGFFFEVRPKSGSIVFDINRYQWKDNNWIERRKTHNWFDAPMSIYEVHLGSWMRVPEDHNRFLTYRELAGTLIEYVKGMGYTHIELLPVAEHPLDESWGYQTIGYFAPTSRFGTPEDFMFFIDQCHQNNIGVVLDWAPAHFPKDGHGLAFFDGTALYEHQDPRKGEHRDWGTLIFNYGRNEVRNFLISNGLFWFDKYHIDGLRVDAVASMLYLDYSRQPGEWEPNVHGGNENLEAVEFVKKFNEVAHQYFPGILTIAEESTAWPAVSRPVYLGGLGFDMKWNMGWMHDMLEYFSKEPIHRKYHHNYLTFSLLYAFTENFILVLSHDEVVHGKRSMLDKMPGDDWQRFANLRLFYGYMFAHPGKKLLFMGGEIAQGWEWNSQSSLDWHLLEYPRHRGIQRFCRDLNRVYTSEPSLYDVDFEYKGFEWIDFHDTESSVISFIRYSKKMKEHVVIVCNFTPVPRYDYKIGVPAAGFYREILNSDSMQYGGSNLGNLGGVHSEPVPWHNQPNLIKVALPPLAVVYFKLA